MKSVTETTHTERWSEGEPSQCVHTCTVTMTTKVAMAAYYHTYAGSDLESQNLEHFKNKSTLPAGVNALPVVSYVQRMFFVSAFVQSYAVW